MTFRIPSLAHLLTLAIALSSTTSPSLSAPQPVLVAPSGWIDRSQGAPKNVLGLWISPETYDQFSENLNVFVEPFTGTLNDYVRLTRNLAKKTMADAEFDGATKAVRVCNGRLQGALITYHANNAGKPLVFEATIAIVGAKAFVATDTRLASLPPTKAAHSALLTLCPPR